MKLKPLLFLALQFILCLSSCSKDDNQNEDPEGSIKFYPEAPKVQGDIQFKKVDESNGYSVNKILAVNETIYACTDRNGILISFDRGAEWNFYNEGIDDSKNQVPESIYTYDISTFDHSIYLLGNNVFYSKNGGRSWVSTNYDQNKLVGSAVVCAIDESTVCVTAGSGKFNYMHSSNFGQSWNKIVFDFSFFIKYVQNKDLLYASTVKALYVSYDKGVNWNSIGPESVSANTFVVIDDIVILASNDGIYSKNNEEEWKKDNNFGLPEKESKEIWNLIETDNWLIVMVKDSIYISKLIRGKLANWQKINYSGLDQAINTNGQGIKNITYSNDRIFMGVRSTQGSDAIEGSGIYYADFTLN